MDSQQACPEQHVSPQAHFAAEPEKQAFPDTAPQQRALPQQQLPPPQQAIIPSNQSYTPAPMMHQAPQLQQTQPQPIVMQVGSSRRRPTIKEKYNSRLSNTLGIIQIICGLLAIILNASGIAIQTTAQNYDYYTSYSYGSYYWYDTAAYYVGTGFWCATLCILSGVFAVRSAKTKTSCWIITHMVHSIIASVLAFIMFGMAVWAVAQDAERIRRGFRYRAGKYNDHDIYDDSYYQYDIQGRKNGQASLAVSVIFMIVALVEIVACIWSSTLCCKVMCCGGSSNQTLNQGAVQYMANTGTGQPQILVLDRRGRLVRDAQVIQVAGPTYGAPSGLMQMPQTNLGSPAAMAVNPMVSQTGYPVQVAGMACPAPPQNAQPPPYRT